MRGRGGFHIALVPSELLPEQIEAALNELGVEAEAVLELSDPKQPSRKRTGGMFAARATNPAHAQRVCPDLRSAEAGDRILSCSADVFRFPSS